MVAIHHIARYILREVSNAPNGAVAITVHPQHHRAGSLTMSWLSSCFAGFLLQKSLELGTDPPDRTLASGEKLFYLQLELFCLQLSSNLSFFAYCPLKALIRRTFPL